MRHELLVNGQALRVDAEPDTPLLFVLRNSLGLLAAKFGCGLGLCGACMVWVDGHPTPSCDLPVGYATGRTILTLEGLGSEEEPHRVQAAFIARQAAQCGFCVAGILMTGAAYVRDGGSADPKKVAEALDRHLCRCGAHARMVAAISEAARSTKPADHA